MIEKLPTHAPFGVQDDWRNKINELVDAVNELQLDVSKMENLEHLKKIGQGFKKRNDPCCKQITYTSDGHITVFHGYDSIVELEHPLPAGTRITIKSKNKKEQQ